MTADQIRKQRERLASAEPFAELAEAAGGMILHLAGVQDVSAQIRTALLDQIDGALPGASSDLRNRILDDYNLCRERLHAAVDRVMRTSLMDAQPTLKTPD